MQDPGIEKLVEKAMSVHRNSYAPYSNVHVAAAVEADDGTVYTGVNVENASYGLTICAERAAVAAMVAAGRRRIARVAIVADTPEPLPPCGACRQVLAEFGDPETLVVSVSTKTGRRRSWRLGELLPYAFTASHIEENRGSDAAP
ncbi:cytidine deaminase [Pyrodictium abyssi]|uniref:cytidine deaminase n=1 Tax=Pyrodictium abyssi TaxID=54256 RepID=A0ABN6ZP54_9CREN|nr:cytidine deaminase [Pyrodictium abyssi]